MKLPRNSANKNPTTPKSCADAPTPFPRRTTILFLSCILTACLPPSDAKLKRAFHANEREFTELLTLFQSETAFNVVSTTFTQPNYEIGSKRGMPIDRFKKFQLHLQNLDLKDVVRRNDAVILFTVSASGFLTKGLYKGYAYSATPPAKLYPYLEPSSDDTFTDCDPHYESMQGNWYLYVINCL